MIYERYANAMKLLESGNFKQSEIAEQLNISLDIVKKLSQLSKIYKITNDEELLNSIKELNFKALELKHLKYKDTLGEVLGSLNKSSSRDEIKQACINANNLKLEDLKKNTKDRSDIEKKIERYENLKKYEEERIRHIEFRIKEIENKYGFLEKIFEDVDPGLAAFVYNRYIEIKLIETEPNSWGLEYSTKRDAKITRDNWDHLVRCGIVERRWRTGYSGYSYALNTILDIRKFVEYMSKFKTKRTKVTELELEIDRTRALKKREIEIKEIETNISQYDMEINELTKNLNKLDLSMEKERTNILPTYKREVYKYNGIRTARQGDLYLDNVFIDNIKIDRLFLDEDGHVTIYIKDKINLKNDADKAKAIFNKYSDSKFQLLRKMARTVIIVISIKTSQGYTYIENIELNKLRELLPKTMEVDNYIDEVEVTREDELLHLIGLNLSKKFLY